MSKKITMWRVWSTWQGTPGPKWITYDPSGLLEDSSDAMWQRYEVEAPDGWHVDPMTEGVYDERGELVTVGADDDLRQHELGRVYCMRYYGSDVTLPVTLVEG